MKKIALLGPTHPYRGGIVHFNTKLGKELRETDDVELKIFSWKRLYPTILLPKPEKAFQDHRSKSNIKVAEDRILDYINPISWLSLVNKVRRFSPDIFLTHWTHPIHFPVYWVIIKLIKLFTSSKVYLIAHNVKPHEASPLNLITTKFMLKIADKVIVHAKDEAAEANNIISKEKIITAFHPLYNIFPVKKRFNIDKFRQELGLKKNIILFFGFIRPYKGLEYLIEAFNDVRRDIDDVSLLIVGELFWKVEEQKSILKRIRRIPFQIFKKITLRKDVEMYDPLKLISELGMQDDCVVIDSYVPNEDVFKYYTVSDVFVAPYTSASQSGPVQISYAFNKPVIISNVGGLKDVVDDGVSGYLVQSKDSKDLAEKMVQFFRSSKIDGKNVEKYKKRFEWGKYIEMILKSYE